MDTVYGTKKYFQSLGASDSDYYNRSSTNRAVVSSLFFCLLFLPFFLNIYTRPTHSAHTAAGAHTEYFFLQYYYFLFKLWENLHVKLRCGRGIKLEILIWCTVYLYDFRAWLWRWLIIIFYFLSFFLLFIIVVIIILFHLYVYGQNNELHDMTW